MRLLCGSETPQQFTKTAPQCFWGLFATNSGNPLLQPFLELDPGKAGAAGIEMMLHLDRVRRIQSVVQMLIEVLQCLFAGYLPN